MKKSELREHGFSLEERIPKKFTVNMLWFGIMIFMVVGTFLLIISIVGYTYYIMGEQKLIPVTSNISETPRNIIGALILLILYFAFKLVLSVIFSSDRLNSVRLKILEGNVMPVCFCGEALEVWQFIVMYFVPAVVIYSIMFTVSAFQVYVEMEYSLMMMTILVSFFLAFDLTLVIYLLRIKIKEKIDYIAINHHVYEMTLFKSTYVRTGNNKNQLNQLVNKKLEPQNKIKVFEFVMTCVNPRCENYACELESEENKSKRCQSCGKHTYNSEVFKPIATCVNPKCENYKQELIDSLKECPLCRGQTEGILRLKHNPGLVKPALIMSLISAFVFNFLLWFLWYIKISFIEIAIILSLTSYVAGIIISILSKNRNTVIIAVMSVPLFYVIFKFLPDMTKLLETIGRR